MDELQTRLENGIADTIIRGTNPAQTAQDISSLAIGSDKDFAMAYHRARTLVHTELAHIYNTASMERYEEAGCAYWEFLSAEDDRVCDSECAEYNRHIYPMSDTEHLPPIHPNCRCVVMPVIGR